jgi:hypothetical protein
VKTALEVPELKGAFDLHVHAAPDVVPRKCDDLELAHAAAAAGMAGFLLKSHLGSTVERAYLASHLHSGIKVSGGIVLNDPVGGLNPAAVDIALRLGGRCVWFPTQSAANHRRTKQDLAQGGLTVLDDDGSIVPAVHEILELIAGKDVILATGHLSVEETLALANAARKRRIQRFLVTHAELDVVSMPVDVQQQLAAAGCFIEHSLVCIHALGGSVPFEQIARNIAEVGPERCVITTDYGQRENPLPPEGLLDFITRLLQMGFSRKDIDLLAVRNPAQLIGE